MKMFGKFAAVAALALIPFSASAAPINLAEEDYQLANDQVGTGDMTISIFADFFDPSGPLSLSATTFLNTSGVGSSDVTDAAEYSFSFSFDAAGATSPTGEITGTGASILGFMAPNLGALPGTPEAQGSIGLIFEGVSGSGIFDRFDGEDVLVTLSDDYLDGELSFFGTTGSMTVDLLDALPTTEIPLPAGGLLLLTAAGALLVKRKKTA